MDLYAYHEKKNNYKTGENFIKQPFPGSGTGGKRL